MNHWNLIDRDVIPHQPEILSSSDDARAVVIALPAGERLSDHEVHERAFVTVASGDVVMHAGDEDVSASAGHLFEFDPGERHEVEATTDARLLLLLTPWPGDGHPGTMSLADKATARERAAEHPPNG
jgi:quercetin dioxygenase-like cupin family protein